MKPQITYRTKLTQVDGDLKATVSAKHLATGLAVVSRPLNSEQEAKAEAQAKLAQNLKDLETKRHLYPETRRQNHVNESL